MEARAGPSPFLDPDQATSHEGTHCTVELNMGPGIDRETRLERTASPAGPASSAVLSRAAAQPDGRLDGCDGRLPGRRRALRRQPLLAPAQLARAHGAQVAETSVRDRGDPR